MVTGNIINNTNALDIALIQPPGWAVQNPPLGLALLKPSLAQHGLSAKNFDLNVLLYRYRHGVYSDAWELSNGYYTWGNESYVRKMALEYAPEAMNFIYNVLSFQPKVIGLSAHWASINWASLLARKFKQYSSETKIVFGGPQTAHYTRQWRDLLENGIADAVIFGEGEESLSDYFHALKTDSLQKVPIKGLAYKGVGRSIVDGGSRELIKSLDSIPFADFSDFDLDLYEGRNVLPTYFSRGCVNRCCYCTESKFFPTFRNRTGQRVFEEVMYQKSLHPKTEYFRMHDSVSNGNIKELEAFCDLLIENKVGIHFNLENAVIRKEMDSRLYRKLKNAGCTLIGYGLETPSKPLLKLVGKTACLSADFEKVMVDGVRSGMTIGLNMMFGLPGEQDADFQQQLAFIKKLRKFRRHILINPALNFCYFPEGSEVFANPGKFDVDMTCGELYWESKDGSNTFLRRLAKFEEFCKLAARLGYENFFGVVENANKNVLLGQYYLIKGDEEKALDYFIASFMREAQTVELANEILRLYGKLSRGHDDVYIRAENFISLQSEDTFCWVDDVNTEQELREFVLRQSLVSSLNRFQGFMDDRAARQRPGQAVGHGFKPTIKRFVMKVLNRVLERTDERQALLLEMSRELDNKIDALMDVPGRPKTRAGEEKR